MRLFLLLTACTVAPPDAKPEESTPAPVDSVAPDSTWVDTAPGDADGDGSLDPDDCDDTNPAIHPGATEVCNGVDDDCDTAVDEGLPTSTYYPDTDGDGYGSGIPLDACALPAGYAENQADCDDTDPATWPGAPDPAHDGVDQDCDGEDLCDPDTLTPYVGPIGFGGEDAAAEMAAFCTLYDAVEGEIYLGSDLLEEDLSGLSCLRCVSDRFAIEGAPNLTSLNGLDNLVWAGGGVAVVDAPQLASLSGLEGLRAAGSDIALYELPALVDASALDGVEDWPGQVTVYETQLSDLMWMRNVTELGVLYLVGNPNMPDFRGLENLATVSGDGTYGLLILNTDITATTGLEGLRSVAYLVFESNSRLTDLGALHGITSLGRVAIKRNRSLPQAEIDAFLAAVGKENIYGDILIEENGP